MSATPKPPSSEDIVGQKLDRCFADFLVKAGVGFSAGVVLSVVLFRRPLLVSSLMRTQSDPPLQAAHGPSLSPLVLALALHTLTATVPSTQHGYLAPELSPNCHPTQLPKENEGSER
ncbi:MICOS complex subunit MIC10 [Mycena indigotica]|uniref:MICOS complex subunit MIC10 n=1 Tax=Mycena indigotica TaxID=2126181 RepID=A0A8H6VZ28_9AGAR|nr:MICOS complex subunit MIC10 [Mycena indigotica]KAF7295548.1 MICOS complex subunit MIC10 [Mycena indigotica]